LHTSVTPILHLKIGDSPDVARIEGRKNRAGRDRLCRNHSVDDAAPRKSATTHDARLGDRVYDRERHFFYTSEYGIQPHAMRILRGWIDVNTTFEFNPRDNGQQRRARQPRDQFDQTFFPVCQFDRHVGVD